MDDPRQNRADSGLGLILVVLFLVLAGGLALVSFWLFLPVGPQEPPQPSTSMSAEAIRASLNRLDPETPIIGVVVGGIAKAYPVRNLMRPDQHVINDLVGGVPITITWCDVDRCAKAITGPGSKPLEVSVAGADASRPGKLLLKQGQTRFWQDTFEVFRAEGTLPPLQVHPSVETTWNEWKTRHPDTLVQEVPFGS